MFVEPDMKSLAVAADRLRWRSKVYKVWNCSQCGSPKLADNGDDGFWCSDCGWGEDD